MDETQESEGGQRTQKKTQVQPVRTGQVITQDGTKDRIQTCKGTQIQTRINEGNEGTQVHTDMRHWGNQKPNVQTNTAESDGSSGESGQILCIYGSSQRQLSHGQLLARETRKNFLL